MTQPHLTPDEWYYLTEALDARLEQLENGDLGVDDGDEDLAEAWEHLLDKLGPSGSHMYEETA